MQNITKISGSIKGFALCVPAAGHFFYAHIASTSRTPPSHPEITFNFSALGLVALGFTVLPLAGSLPLLVCQFSYPVAISWPSLLSLGLSSQPELIRAPWPVQGHVGLGFCYLLGTFKSLSFLPGAVSVVAPETLCALVIFSSALLEPSAAIAHCPFWFHCPSAALFVVAHWFSLGKMSELFVASANLFAISVP